MSIRLLLADDQALVRQALATLLDLEDDFEVVTVADADQASARLGWDRIDVVLADFRLPGRSGLSLLHEVARTHPAIVGVLVTGHADLPEVQAARGDQDVFHVVQKPYDPDSLIGWMDSAAKSARLRRTVQRLHDTLGTAKR